MTEFCQIPQEIALQILSRLLPKSLMRFKCVHKSWCILINNPCFIAKHLSNGMHNNHSTCLLLKRLVAKDTDADEKETLLSLINIGNDNDDDMDNINCVAEDMTNGPFNGLKVLQSAWIVGNCNGIICLADLSYVIMLLNPAIMEFRLVTLKPYVPGENLNLGFGYDTKSKNYKVVHISRLREEIYGDQHLIFNPCTIEVYTVANDSWRQIMTDSLETETTNLYPHDFQIYFKGFCYWTGCEQLKEFISIYDHGEEEELRQVIILFDMGEEVFHYILFPDSLYESYVCWYGMCLMVWKESIALFGMDHGIIDAESWGLWVMGDVIGVEGYWIKQYTFGNAEGIDAPLQFWKGDEILLVSDEGCIVSYNLDTEDLTHLPIHKMGSECYEFVAYMTSIVAIIDSNVGHSRDRSPSVSRPKS